MFFEYRESVKEAYALLLQARPEVKPKIFLGQGAMTQAQQIHVSILVTVLNCKHCSNGFR